MQRKQARKEPYRFHPHLGQNDFPLVPGSQRSPYSALGALAEISRIKTLNSFDFQPEK